MILYLMTDEKGLQGGILIDLRDEPSRNLGFDTKVVGFETFTDLFDASKKKDINAVYCMMPSRAKEPGLLPSEVFLRSYVAIYTQHGAIVKTLEAMIGKKVTMVKDQNLSMRLIKPYREQV